jgi:ABC-type sugar transport system permease subunit
MPSDDTRVGLALLLPLIGLVFFVSLYPMLYSLWLSIHDASFTGGIASFTGLDNYLAIPGDSFVLPAAIVSIRFVAETTALIFLIGLGLALLLNEKIPARSVLKVLVILPWALSEFAVALTGRFFLDSNFGFLNAILVRLNLVKYGVFFLNAKSGIDWISIFYAWNFAPIGAFFILSSLQTVPEDLYKAAKVDGASTLGRFRLVTFPFIKYSVLITLVLATIQAGGAVVIFFALTGGGPGFASTPITLYDFIVFFQQGNYGYGSAISWLTLAFVASATTSYFYLLTRRRR